MSKIHNRENDRTTWALAAMGARQANFSLKTKPGSGQGLT